MGCVNPDGTLSASARKMLKILTEAKAPEEASVESGEPLFRVRASLREMEQAGLLELAGNKYRTTSRGREMADLDK